MYPVITISREFGSGGHSIGVVVAKKLDIPFYDGRNSTSQQVGKAKELIKNRRRYFFRK